jgi:hypothetical protein
LDTENYTPTKGREETIEGDMRRYFFLLFYLLFSLPSVLGYTNLSTSLVTGSFWDGYFRTSSLFIASGRGVDVFDISNPNTPSLIYSLDTPGICSDICLRGSFLYTADGFSGVGIYEVTDPLNPLPIDFYSSQYEFIEICIRDSVFAASTYPHGITLLRHTSLGSIEYLSHIVLNNSVKGLLFIDSLLIAGLSGAGFTIYNISDPYNPSPLLPSYPIPVTNDIAGKDTLLFVSTGMDGISVFSIRNPNSPIHTGTFSNSDYMLSVSLYDTLLFSTGLLDTLYLISVQDPLNLYQTGSIKTVSHTGHCTTNGTVLYASETSTGELFDAVGLTKYANIDSLYPVKDGYITDSIAYVSVFERGLILLDVHDMHAPSPLSAFDSVKFIEEVHVKNSTAYLSCGENGLYLLDVSDPFNITIPSLYNTPGTLHKTFKRGNRLFCADGGSGILVLSIEDPFNPYLIDSLNLPGHAYEIIVSDTIGYVSLGQEGIAIIDVEDGGEISLLCTFASGSFTTALSLKTDYLFAATRDSGVYIYDITSPTNPVHISTHPVSSQVNDIVYQNELLYCANDLRGIDVVDVSDPLIPIKIDSLDTPGRVQRINPYLGILAVPDYYGFRLDSFPYVDTIPPSPVSNLTLEPQDSTIVLRWINPGDFDYCRTRLVYRNDTFPSGPFDGDSLLEHRMEPYSPDSFSHSGLPGDSTHFYYSLYAFDYMGNFSSASISGISMSDTIPPGEVSQISFTFHPPDTLEVFFMTPNDSDFVGVRAMYRTDHPPENIYDGNLFFDNLYDPNSLCPEKLFPVSVDTMYFFTFFSKDNVPNFSGGSSDSFRIPRDTIPPEEVTIDTVLFWSDTVELHITTPQDVDFYGVKALYNLLHFPQDTSDGTIIYNAQLPQDTSITITQKVLFDTTYFYTFFTKDTVPNFSDGETLSVKTFEDSLPPDTLKGFTVTRAFPDSIIFTWVNPDSSDLDVIKIRYSKEYFPYYPPHPDSGKPRYTFYNQSPGDTFFYVWKSDHLTPGVHYYFSGFAIDKAGNVSPPVFSRCLTPKLTKISDTYPPEPIQGGYGSWLDSVEVSFTAPIQLPSLEIGTEIVGRAPYSFRIEEINDRYHFIPHSFSSLDTITITLRNTITDSIGNPFDGDGNGFPDTADTFTWSFYTHMICDYTGNDTVNSEDFAIFKNSYLSQDLTKEVGPCSSSLPYLTLIPDSVIDFEDFSVFVMMWNWSLDTRGYSEVSVTDTDSLLQCGVSPEHLVIETTKREGLISGEIILSDLPEDISTEKGDALGDGDIFISRMFDSTLVISFGIMEEGNRENEILLLPRLTQESLAYSYRLVYREYTKKGKGIFSLNNSIPHRTVFQSIHPNPGKRFTLTFGIPQKQNVTLDLFDVSGRNVTTLFKGEVNPGYHSVSWDGTESNKRIPSGIYFVRLKTKNTTQIKPLILIR